MSDNILSPAESLALLLEDAADYRAAQEHLARIVLRNGTETEASRLLTQVERRIRELANVQRRLQTALTEPTP